MTTELWLTQLQKKGHRVTRARRAIVDVIQKSTHALTPLEVFDLARKKYRALGLVSVYRTLEKLEPLVERLRALGPTTEVISLAFDDPRLIALSQESDLIVNTTSVGLKEGDGSPLPEDCLRAGLCVYDTIYQPAVTPLLAAASAAGARVANGLSLLLHQGALAFQHWFPHTDPLPYMREALGIHAAKTV